MPFAAVGGAVASAAVSAGIGALTSKGQSSAISGGVEQANALSEKTIQEARDNYATDRANAQPFLNVGTTGANQLGSILGLNGADAAAEAQKTFTQSPGYQFAFDQGSRAVDASAAAKGMLRSGAQIKAQQQFGTGLANQEFGNYLTRLNSLAGIGLQGASLGNQSTATFNNLLTGQSSNQQSTITSGAGQEASIYGNAGKALGDAAGGLAKNYLYDTALGGAGNGGGVSSVWNGAGGGYF